MENFLKKIPLWLILVVVAYIAIMFSYAVFDGRGVKLWTLTIAPKTTEESIEQEQMYKDKVKELEAAQASETNLRMELKSITREKKELAEQLEKKLKELTNVQNRVAMLIEQVKGEQGMGRAGKIVQSQS